MATKKTQFTDLETNKTITMGVNMEKITERQLAYLIKLGKTEKEVKSLSKSDASSLIVELKKAQIEQPKVEKTEKATSTKKETSKKATSTATKKATKKSEQPKVETTDTLNEQLTKAIKIAYNGELKKELAFIQESKIDELAQFIIDYAKKNAKSGGFGLDTKTLLDLSKKFVDSAKEPKEKFSFTLNFETETEKVEKPKKATPKKATTTEKVVEKKAETPKKTDTAKKTKTTSNNSDNVIEQLSLLF